ncbi:hypothetical protein AMECASPLE_007176 [Ameca splendens]|uniref:Secreted protein n=1 Tax=Ameca splendens TaxID=208324 RepID=A0ABV0XZG6_9TELE
MLLFLGSLLDLNSSTWLLLSLLHTAPSRNKIPFDSVTNFSDPEDHDVSAGGDRKSSFLCVHSDMKAAFQFLLFCDIRHNSRCICLYFHQQTEINILLCAKCGSNAVSRIWQGPFVRVVIVLHSFEVY